MLAFHNDPAIKAKYLARVEGHIKADNLIRGTGWDGFRGCAVGCTLENYDHSQYPIELGIPEWLARVEDGIFEGMSDQKSRTWPKDFLDAIKSGADLEKAKAPFLVMVLEGALTTFDHRAFPHVRAAINGAIDLWRRNDIGSEEWRAAAWSARAAAESAAESAAWAAESAAWSARAAAESAAWSARAAAESAARAAWAAESAARAGKYDEFADGLLSILRSIEP